MRRVVVFALLALALPLAAWADGITLTNQDGTVSISGMTGTGGLGTIGVSTITSKGSELTQWNGTQAKPGGALGSVSFSTGALLSGSISGGGTFAAGGSFDVTGVGKWAESLTGSKGPVALFTGSFTGPITWTLDSSTKNQSDYTLSGAISGTLWNGRVISGSTTQNIDILSRGQLNQGVGHLTGGTTGLSTPEPATLGLLGTGLLGIAGIFRRKRKS
ncbi:MAG TPA: PEP-CTERM sorting domain-containing protein [Terriglobales bacterium]|jgi:hypothetical protein|nr:PEP-CTERM sorting domain-containing protein [Terriglobales bacterium]